jgi:hypothetical protein
LPFASCLLPCHNDNFQRQPTYVQELHRKLETIKLLIDVATKKAESFKITDIDVLGSCVSFMVIED